MISEGAVVCFGEILIRLSAPDNELLLQSPRLSVHFGGAEANVAVSLSRLGGPARMVSFVPDNALGRAALDELRRYGVNVEGVGFAPGRMGLYFLTPGAMLRPSEVTYDRAGSTFAQAAPDAVDWHEAMRGAAVLHFSGITPALGPNAAAAALRAAKAARGEGVTVSFDGNFRGKLWAAWGGDGPAVLRDLLACADLAFIDDRDIALVLGHKFASTEPSMRRREAARRPLQHFRSSRASHPRFVSSTRSIITSYPLRCSRVMAASSQPESDRSSVSSIVSAQVMRLPPDFFTDCGHE